MKLPISEEMAVGAIGDQGFSGIDVGETVNERTFVSSVVASYGLNNFTAGEGPVGIYIAHSDYTNAEVAEAILATNGWDRGNKVAREQAKRLVRLVGLAEIEDDGEEKLFDGRPRKIKLNWLLEEGDTLQFGVFALSGTITAGGQIDVLGHANGWLR